MPRKASAISLIVAGVAMMIAGVAAKSFFAPETFWSEEQAQEYSEAAAALKTAATGRIRRPSPATDPKLAAAQERFNRIQAELDWATKRRDYLGVVLGICGAALLAVGVGTFLLGPGVTEELSSNR